MADLLPQGDSDWQLGAGGQALEGLAEGQLADGLAKTPAEGLGNGSGRDQVAEVDHAVDGQFSIEFADADVDADADATADADADVGPASMEKGVFWSTASAFSVILWGQPLQKSPPMCGNWSDIFWKQL